MSTDCVRHVGDNSVNDVLLRSEFDYQLPIRRIAKLIIRLKFVEAVRIGGYRAMLEGSDGKVYFFEAATIDSLRLVVLPHITPTKSNLHRFHTLFCEYVESLRFSMQRVA